MAVTVRYETASITLRPTPDETVWLTNLIVGENKKEDAQELLALVCNAANTHNLILQLDARSSGFVPHTMNNGEVILFYESFGFISFPTLSKRLMERMPQPSQ